MSKNLFSTFLLLLALALVQQTVSFKIDDAIFHNPSHMTRLRDATTRGGFDAPKNKVGPAEEKDPDFWINIAHDEVASRVASSQRNMNKAKNIIMFLGDGMSSTTVTAARILKGQRLGNPGEESSLSFEKFPSVALSRTYCTNAQVADSACTATAYLCGVKTNMAMLGVSANVGYNDCSASMDPANHVSSIAAWAQAAGKSTGIITTTTLTHASPSGAYAHSASRFFESDTDIQWWAPGTDSSCMDIATQLVTQEPGRNFDVMFGGGASKFLPNTMIDAHGNPGIRADGKDLLHTWQMQNPQGEIVMDRDQLLNLDISKTSKVMGLFNSNVMDFHLIADAQKQPTLTEMTEVAIKMLSKNENGYFVFIEGGLIDYGNHATTPALSLDETLEMEKAIQRAREMTNSDDTLIVVTADHAHPLSISGYPERGNNILGLNQDDVDANGVKYTTLNYALGTHQYLDEQGKRIDLTEILKDPIVTFPSGIPAEIGVHAGDDVNIYASGPYDHLFKGVMQQNSIPHLMAYAACIGDGPTMCDA